MTVPVGLINERLSEGLDPNDFHFMRYVRCPDAFFNPGGFVLPVAVYDHGQGCSVTGGYVYRGSSFPALRGFYFYGDFCSGRVWVLRKSGTSWENFLLSDTAFSISAFGEDEAGELYLADYGTGTLYRVGSP